MKKIIIICLAIFAFTFNCLLIYKLHQEKLTIDRELDFTKIELDSNNLSMTIIEDDLITFNELLLQNNDSIYKIENDSLKSIHFNKTIEYLDFKNKNIKINREIEILNKISDDKLNYLNALYIIISAIFIYLIYLIYKNLEN